LDSARTKLEQGIKALAAKQKHIKMADRSKHGWNTVAHYQEDLLASDPEDDKEIKHNIIIT